MTRVHPRSHGENFYFPYKMLEYAGSSPLTLGKRCFDCELAPVVRLIPTYGGKTLGMQPRLRSASAHPRTHGENGARGIPYPYKTGPSPLTRGKTTPRNCRRGVGWFIPADRGKLICIDEVHVSNWKASECTGATSPPHSTPAHANHTQRSSTRHTCALMAEPRSSSRSRMPCPDQFH